MFRSHGIISRCFVGNFTTILCAIWRYIYMNLERAYILSIGRKEGMNETIFFANASRCSRRDEVFRFVPGIYCQPNYFAFNRFMAWSTNKDHASSEYSVVRHFVELYCIPGRRKFVYFHYILNQTTCTIRVASLYIRKQLICILQKNFCISLFLFSDFSR